VIWNRRRAPGDLEEDPVKTELCASVREGVPSFDFGHGDEAVPAVTIASGTGVRSATRRSAGERTRGMKVIRAVDFVSEAGAALVGVGKARGNAA